MKKKLGSSLLALSLALSSTLAVSTTEVLANDTLTSYSVFENTVATVAEDAFTASGTIDFTGTEGKFEDGEKPCCIGCFSKYVLVVAEDGTEHTATLTKTADWSATWEVDGLSDGNYTVRLSTDYPYYYAYTITGSFTVAGKNVTNSSLYIVDQTTSASGAIIFKGTEGKFADGTKPCCIGCFSNFLVVTDANGVERTAYLTKTDTWEGAWIVGDLENGEYTLSISDEYDYSDYYEVEDGTFTITNNQSLIALSFAIIDSTGVTANPVVTTTVVEVVETAVTVTDTATTEVVASATVTANVANNDTSDGPTFVPSTIVKLLNQLF